MQLSIYINQERMIEWKLNLTQASLVAILAQAPTWAEHKTIDGKLYFWVSKNIIISELPAVFKAKDTVYRTLKNLEEKGLIEYAKQGDKDMVCLTEEIKKWNIKDQPSTSEKNPRFGKKSELTRKKIRIASEKNPNHLGKKSDITDNNRSEAYISDANRTERARAHETKKPSNRDQQIEMLAKHGVTETHANDWLEVRKSKRAGRLTRTALEGLLREADRAGISADDAVRICAERGWQGFNASWNWRDDPPSRSDGATTVSSEEAQRKAYAQEVTEQILRRRRTIDGGRHD